MEAEEDINAAFDSILLGEDRVVELGFEAGYTAGSAEGRLEGARLGRQRGAEVGREVGFYLGFAEELTSAHSDQSDEKKTAKISIALHKLLELIEAFPEDNSKEEDIAAKLEQIRARFKVVCSLLKVSLEPGTAGGAAAW
jgi:HUS1 checkpoint protein